MAARAVRIATVMRFFREADADEVRAVMPLVIETVGKRHILIDAGAAAPKRRTRRKRLNGELAPEQAKGATV